MFNILRWTLYVCRPGKRSMLYETCFRMLLGVASGPIHASVRQFYMVIRASLYVVVLIGMNGNNFSFFKSTYDYFLTFLLLPTCWGRGSIRREDGVIFVTVFALLRFPSSLSRRRFMVQRYTTMGGILIR